VIEFGYVTLFASAFPLASILSILCNWVEMKSDLFKITHVVRRPEAFQADSLGTWDTVLEGMIWLSVVTNVMIFGFSSKQMTQWFPNMFDADDEFNFSAGSARYAVGTVFAIEHFMIILGLIFLKAVANVPDEVQDALARRKHLNDKDIKEYYENQAKSKQQ
jgi:hypothetical protein